MPDKQDKIVPDEGELAADYLETLLDIADLDGDIEIEIGQDRTYVSVGSAELSDLKLLSGAEVVAALQDLTRLAVQKNTGVFSRLVLDIGGSRESRVKEIAELVDLAAEKVRSGAKSVALPSMSSYERKLVHDMVAEKGLSSKSECEGKSRHTVISSTA